MVKFNTSEFVMELPDSIFWKKDIGGAPDYKRVYFEVLSRLFPSGSLPLEEVLRDRFPNPSTIQRLIAEVARQRRGLY